MKELTKKQYNKILKELREIKQIMATKNETAKNKGNENNREIKDIVEDIGDITDRICERIDSMCHKMNEAILEAYGMPISPRRRCRNVTRPIYYREDGINSTRARSTNYIY